MSVAETVTNKLALIPDGITEMFEDSKLSEEEKDAINEAIRLADEYPDIKPDHLVLSGNHLFDIKKALEGKIKYTAE